MVCGPNPFNDVPISPILNKQYHRRFPGRYARALVEIVWITGADCVNQSFPTIWKLLLFTHAIELIQIIIECSRNSKCNMSVPWYVNTFFVEK